MTTTSPQKMVLEGNLGRCILVHSLILTQLDEIKRLIKESQFIASQTQKLEAQSYWKEVPQSISIKQMIFCKKRREKTVC
jgi:hypothetical protein